MQTGGQPDWDPRNDTGWCRWETATGHRITADSTKYGRNEERTKRLDLTND